ncbi:hypothetical protein [Chitinophaga sp. YIM B06452]|uniref:hypothetical protein n=1 Tax=Chitinophaga sp. YIM B06452 TaxID=3082158 RepID=UPI0031FE6B94
MKTLLTIAACMLITGLSKAQTAAADNKISEAITFQPIPGGPSFLGAFEGRAPCAGLAQQLKLAIPGDCEKLKCRLTLFRDPATSKPARFMLRITGGGDVKWQDGHSYRLKELEGKWSVSKGLPSDPNGEVYTLEVSNPGVQVYLLKGDDNVFFILDEQKRFRVGNGEYSYTLNRVKLVPGK